MIRPLLRRLGFNRSLQTLKSQTAYALWAQNYPPEIHNPLMSAEQAAMIQLLPELAGKTVLDLACGTGRYARIANEHGAAQVIGVDNSLDMLRLNHHASLAQSTTEALPLRADSADVILCGLALGHLPQVDSSLVEIARILRAGGIALISDFHPFQFLSGAKRTFKTSDGAAYAVEHYPHLYSDYHKAARAASLTIDAVLEPQLTGKTGPVVLVIALKKPG